VPFPHARLSIPLSIDEANRRFWRDEVYGSFVALIDAAVQASQIRYPTENEQAAFERWFTDEWQAISAGLLEPFERVFRGRRSSVATILYSIYADRNAEQLESPQELNVYLSTNRHDYWFEPAVGSLLMHYNWLLGIARAVRHAPECTHMFGDTAFMPDNVRNWLLVRDATSASATEYLQQRAARVAAVANRTIQPSVEVPQSGRAPFHPTELDELRYQLINLRLLCQMYWRGAHTLYKCATVILRTLFFRSAGVDPLVRLLTDPQLPKLLVEVDTASIDHLTIPTRISLAEMMNLEPGVRIGQIVQVPGSIGAIRMGALFTDELMPLNDWLDQRFLFGNSTVKMFINWVVHKDGGAHYVVNDESIRRLERVASVHWPLTIRVGEVVADELLRQLDRQNPNSPFAVP